MNGLEILQELRIEMGDETESYMEDKLARVIDIIQAGNCAEPLISWLDEIKDDSGNPKL